MKERLPFLFSSMKCYLRWERLQRNIAVINSIKNRPLWPLCKACTPSEDLKNELQMCRSEKNCTWNKCLELSRLTNFFNTQTALFKTEKTLDQTIFNILALLDCWMNRRNICFALNFSNASYKYADLKIKRKGRVRQSWHYWAADTRLDKTGKQPPTFQLISVTS